MTKSARLSSENIEAYCRSGQTIQLAEELASAPVAEAAEALGQTDNETLLEALSLLDNDRQGQVFALMDMNRQIDFFRHVSKKRFARIFEHMPSDNRADTFQQFSTHDQATLLPYLIPDVRENVLNLSAYPFDSAGGIMSTDYATLHPEQNCDEALEQVRGKESRNRMIYYLYVLDSENQLLGFISLKGLVTADPGEKVGNIMYKEFAFAHPDEDRESVAAKIEKYDLLALPVINRENQLLGIVHHDDAIEVIRTEQTEDMEKFMGIIPGSEILNYHQTGILGHFKKRVIWLAILVFVGFFSGMIIQYYENALAALMILAVYIPMVADTGGNSGSQAATVVIRAMALGELKLNNWAKILLKEARISLLLSLVLGFLAFLLVLVLSHRSNLPIPHSITYIAFGVALAMALQVITATVIGAGLPLLVKRFGGDPAIAASPAITTAVDITGLLIYFGMATLLFF